jgi:hypothetical protein
VTRKGYRGLKSKGHSGTVSMVFGFSSLPSVTFKKKKRGSAHYSRTEHAFKKKEKSKKELRRQRNSGSGGEQVWGSEYCSGPSSNPKFSFG